MEENEKKLNFLEEIIEEDLRTGKVPSILTRFPPEPNGYLHLGHAKSLCINFGLAMKYGAPITAPDIIKTFHLNPIIRYYICWLQSCNKDGCTDFDSLSVDARQAIWLIPDKDQDTLIEILEYEIVQNGQPCYLTLLNYSTLTDHEYQEWQKYLTETLRDF